MPGTEEDLAGALVKISVVAHLKRQCRHQVAVIRQAAYCFSWQTGDVPTEWTHDCIWWRLPQVQDFGQALSAQPVATLKHLGPAAGEAIGAVADLAFQLLGGDAVLQCLSHHLAASSQLWQTGYSAGTVGKHSRQAAAATTPLLGSGGCPMQAECGRAG